MVGGPLDLISYPPFASLPFQLPHFTCLLLPKASPCTDLVAPTCPTPNWEKAPLSAYPG